MRLRTVVGTVGVLATGVAALAVAGTREGPVANALEPLVAALSGLGPRGLVLALALVSALGFLLSLLVPGEERVLTDDGAAERFERLLDRPPEGVTRGAPRTGGPLDDDVARAVAGDEGALAAIRDRLRDLARAALARRADVGESADPVATGEWTDDRTAAAFLADGDPAATLRSRLRLWLDPETERERRIRRTATAIGRLADEVTPATAGEHSPSLDGESDAGGGPAPTEAGDDGGGPTPPEAGNDPDGPTPSGASNDAGGGSATPGTETGTDGSERPADDDRREHRDAGTGGAGR